MIKKAKNKYRMTVNITVEFNAYEDYTDWARLIGGDREDFRKSLMWRATGKVVRPDYNDDTDDVRVTDVAVNSYGIIPESLPIIRTNK